MMALVSNYLPETYTTATAVVVSAVVYVLYIIVRKIFAYSSAPIRSPRPKVGELVGWVS